MAVQRIDIPIAAIGDLCREYGVKELSVFGSALREYFGPESDVDFLVEFSDNNYGPWMAKLTRLEDELSRVVGRRVDLVPKDSLKWVIRDRVLQAAEVVYVAED